MKIYADLLEWKKQSNGSTALIVDIIKTLPYK